MKVLVVVLPTYNERENIQKTIREIFKQQKNLPRYKIHLVVSDSNSPDKTADIVKMMAKKKKSIHLLNVERGLGVGQIKGHLYALDHLSPDVLCQLDADGQVQADILPNLVKAIEEGYDLVLGSRFVQGGRNELSFSRRLFSSGSSWICRIIMGPRDVKEFTNSTRAFTPLLFKKINLDRLPWRELTFISQPAFLHEAILSGARYTEIPLVFKNRESGYSKNKIIKYTYDIFSYTIDVRLQKLGVNFPFFRLTRKIVF